MIITMFGTASLIEKQIASAIFSDVLQILY
jgi:hypothetical protein